MESNNELTSLETAIREAVAAEALPRTGFLLDCYVREAERHVLTTKVDSVEMLDLERRVRDSLDWVDLMVRAIREQASAERRRLESISSYFDQASPSHLAQDQV